MSVGRQLAHALLLDAALAADPPTRPRPNWTPAETARRPNECDRCGAFVSHAFHRQWSDGSGYLDGCRECLPRSVRFGEDIYERDPDDIDFEL